MTLIDMQNGSVVTERLMAKKVLECMNGELQHWSTCTLCYKLTTNTSMKHRLARLA